MAKQQKLHVGHPPENAGARKVTEFREDTFVWELWLRYTGKDWENYKLFSRRAPAKANYWLAWHPVEKRFSDNNDATSLLIHRPRLHERVHRWLTGERGGLGIGSSSGRHRDAQGVWCGPDGRPVGVMGTGGTGPGGPLTDTVDSVDELL